jgi:hypothetical protein
MTLARRCAVHLVLAVLNHPIRAAVLVAVVAWFGWFSGYDVR